MQDGTFTYPEDGADFKYLLELRAEAEYYCLASLVEQIDRFPVSISTQQQEFLLTHQGYCHHLLQLWLTTHFPHPEPQTNATRHVLHVESIIGKCWKFALWRNQALQQSEPYVLPDTVTP